MVSISAVSGVMMTGYGPLLLLTAGGTNILTFGKSPYIVGRDDFSMGMGALPVPFIFLGIGILQPSSLRGLSDPLLSIFFATHA